jgi:hypothetical protein
MLRRGKAQVEPDIKETQMLEFLVDFDKLESPRLLNTHLHFRLLPEGVVDRRCKILHVLRNPKDVAVSYYHHIRNMKDLKYSGSWSDFFPLFLADVSKCCTRLLFHLFIYDSFFAKKIFE